MNIVVIDPTARMVRPMAVPSFVAAKRQFLSEPTAAVYVSDTQMLVYQPFGCSRDTYYFFSRKLEQHFAGTAIVVGSTVDGQASSCGRGMVEAIKKDVLFLGTVEQARKTMSQMAKFAAGNIETQGTTH